MVEKFGKDSPLIIIQNQREEKTRVLDEETRSFKNIKAILPVNFATIDERFATLKNEIEYRICNLPQIGEPVPENWGKVREELERFNANYISKSDYIAICKNYGLTEKFTLDLISSYFHEIGVFLHFQNDIVLRNTVFLKPQWVTKSCLHYCRKRCSQKRKVWSLNHGRFRYFMAKL
ncbi:MAG: hypothetical protein HC831_18135 [Chloroflexia bacterium]|nr:hypothetical protein [Chloroflexia bacterium]